MSRTKIVVPVFISELREIARLGSLAGGALSVFVSCALVAVGFSLDMAYDGPVSTASDLVATVFISLFSIIAAACLCVGVLSLRQKKGNIDKILLECKTNEQPPPRERAAGEGSEE